jgi:hypothetical protein
MFEKNLLQVEKMVKVRKVTELRAFTVCAAVILSGKEQSLIVPRVLLWPTFFVHTEMLPVECSVVD